MKIRIAVGAALAAGLFVMPSVRADVDLAKAEIYVSSNATVPEIEAAKMLIRAQKMIAGGVWETNVAPKVAASWPKAGVVIGWQESALLAPKAKELGLKPWKETKNLGDTIVQMKLGDVYVVAGNSPEGAFYSVGDLLYRNGARCIHTGCDKDGFASGIYLEWMKTLAAPDARTYTPVVAHRTGYAVRRYGKKDAEKIAANVFAVMNGGEPTGPLSGGRGRNTIGCEGIQPPVVEFEKKKDWFPLVNGQRWRPHGGWDWIVNGCYMCEPFKQWVVDRQFSWYKNQGGANMITDVCLTDSDGGQDCNCDGCVKLRKDYPGSDWYWKEQGEINRRINAKIPGLRNYTFAYGHGRRMPNDKKLVAHLDAIQYCPHCRCYVHPYCVKCPTNRADLDQCEGWLRAGIPIGDFDYCYDVFNPAMNMPSWNVTWDVVRYFKELNGAKGVPSIYMEGACGGGCGGKSRASVYAVVRSSWEGATTSAAEHLRDFVRCAYGDPSKEAFAAGSPEKQMLDWYVACAAAWESQKMHLTATFNNPTGTAKTYFKEELVTSGEKAFAATEKAIKARMAPAGTPFGKMTRAQYLAWKQYETWQFEKRVAYDEWKALRIKALSSAMSINLELAGDDDSEFDRMTEIVLPIETWRAADLKKADTPKVTARLYRTAKALKARFTVFAPAYKAVAPAKADAKGFAFNLDHLEVFLQAPGANDYLHLAARPDGTRYDALCMNSDFKSDKWRCATRQKDGFTEYDLTVDWEIFGKDYQPKPGEAVKFLADVYAAIPKQKNGVINVAAGLPRIAFHDLGVAADLMIDDNAGRRAGGN